MNVQVGDRVRLKAATRFGRPTPYGGFAWRCQVLAVSEDGRFAKVKGGNVKRAKWVPVSHLGRMDGDGGDD